MKPSERFTPTDDAPYTKVPNAFIDYWLARLPAAEVRVWLFGCRQTAGFQKEEDAISVKQITDGVFKKDGTRLSHGTGLKRRTAFRALQQLEKQDLVKRVFRPGFATKYRFLCPEPVQPTARGGATQCTPPVHYTAHTKNIVDRNSTKESRKAKINGVSSESGRRQTNGNYHASIADAAALRDLTPTDWGHPIRRGRSLSRLYPHSILGRTLDRRREVAMEATLVESSSPEFPAALRASRTTAEYRQIWATGDLAILDRPLLGFFCSKRCPGEAILRTYDIARALRDAGIPVIGGFHSPMEKECLELLLRGTQPVVACPARSIERMRVPSAWRKAIEAKRLLVLSPFDGSHRRPTAELAVQRNRFVAQLANEIFVVYAEDGSRTEVFCEELIQGSKKVFLLESAASSKLVKLGAVPVSSDTMIARTSPNGSTEPSGRSF